MTFNTWRGRRGVDCVGVKLALMWLLCISFLPWGKRIEERLHNSCECSSNFSTGKLEDCQVKYWRIDEEGDHFSFYNSVNQTGHSHAWSLKKETIKACITHTNKARGLATISSLLFLNCFLVKLLFQLASFVLLQVDFHSPWWMEVLHHASSKGLGEDLCHRIRDELSTTDMGSFGRSDIQKLLITMKRMMTIIMMMLRRRRMTAVMMTMIAYLYWNMLCNVAW